MMKIVKIKYLFFSLCLCVFVKDYGVMAQTPWWFTLEQGKLYYRSGAYGNALTAFEDARRARYDQYSRMEQDFIAFLSSYDVRRLGDSLEFVEAYLSNRRDAAAAAVLEEVYFRVPKSSLNNSVKRVLEELDRLKSYPEAEYWLAETYMAEGELILALRLYQRALQDKALLETPGFETEILYKITEIHRLRQNYQEMEKLAKEIIEGRSITGTLRDELWAGGSPSLTRAAMIRILENDGVNRFLTLYRHHNPLTEKAHRLLGFFYYASNRYPTAAEHLMFAFLIQNTVLIDEIIRREYDFTFTNLNDLMVFVRARPELVSFMEESEYYRTVFYLASALFATGKTRPSRELWSFLASSPDSGEWGERARRNPTPYAERTVDTGR
jgi:tetratricopeptide (TPR) repeat protein